MRQLKQRGEITREWPRSEGMSELIHQLLMRRGIESAEEAERFLHPSRDHLHNPMLLSDMDKAVAALNQARSQNQQVWVYGDYDVDGVSACSILSQAFALWGLDVRTYIPSRHREGYGLNEAAIREIAQQAGCPQQRALLVTVDCGISCAAEVALARDLGLTVVVTDHHRPGDNLPDCPVVNPLLNGYPFPYLCGAGVAFKLAALATVADIVPLVDENRVIVKLGLEVINRQPRPGIQALIQSAGLKGRAITAGSIGFQLGPRLNASGRLGDASRALNLLCGRDVNELNRIAQELEAENTERKRVEQDILADAHRLMQDYDLLGHKILLLKGEGWNSGVIGLAASRLVNEYHYPTILLSCEGGICTGSCRSIPAVDIYAALCTCADLMIRFGGHRQAAGLTIEERHVPELLARLDAHLAEVTRSEDYLPEAEYDLQLPLSLLSDQELARAQAEGVQALNRSVREEMERIARLEAEHFAADEAFLRLLEGEEGEEEHGAPDFEGIRRNLTERAHRLMDRQDLARARKSGVEAAERRTVEALSLIQPTGYGNLTPAFLCRARIDSARGAGQDGSTLQATLSGGGFIRRAVGFHMGEMASELVASDREMIYCPSLNHWKDTVSLQYELKEVLPEGFHEGMDRFERKYQLVFNAYLQDLLYNSMLTEYSFSPETVQREQLAAWLAEDIQGTVIAATTREGAQEISALLQEKGLTGRIGVLVGKWPQEKACYNSLCLCPRGEAPAACRRLILWDAPADAFPALPRTARVYENPALQCAWAREMPDVDLLRQMYVSLRRMLASRSALGSDVIRALAQEVRVSDLCAQAGAAVLVHLNLLEWTHGQSALRLLPNRKCDPAQDALYIRLQALKRRA